MKTLKRLKDGVLWLVIGTLGLYCVEEEPRFALKAFGWRLAFTRGIKMSLDGPTASDLQAMSMLGLKCERRKCKVCGVHFWAWKKSVDVCHRWSCYSRR